MASTPWRASDWQRWFHRTVFKTMLYKDWSSRPHTFALQAVWGNFCKWDGGPKGDIVSCSISHVLFSTSTERGIWKKNLLVILVNCGSLRPWCRGQTALHTSCPTSPALVHTDLQSHLHAQTPWARRAQQKTDAPTSPFWATAHALLILRYYYSCITFSFCSFVVPSKVFPLTDSKCWQGLQEIRAMRW